MLKYAQDNGFPNPTFLIDDGVSGVTFDRPGWNEMIQLAETNKVQTVIVKDMSRMGKQPYGYLRDENNPKQWMADEDAAEVVKRIFALFKQPYDGCTRLHDMLNWDKENAH